jgi:phage terminase Nu1 subunit (DNA packaging protein)
MSPPRLIVGQQEIAQVFSVNVRTVQRWDAEGFPRTPDGRYDVGECVAWAIERQKAETADEFDLARTRKTAAEAEIREHELQLLRGGSVPIASVAAMVKAALTRVDQAVRGAKRRLSRLWARRLGISEAEAMKLFDDMTEEVRAVLRKALSDAGNLAA